jgi:hypothetical protein
VIQRTTGEIIAEVSRGYGAKITADDKHVIYKIKPWYKDTREARIKKKKADDMPKDSLGFISIEDNRRNKLYARVRSFKLPEESAAWAAFYMEKPEPEKRKRFNSNREEKIGKIMETIILLMTMHPGASKDEGADLILKNLQTQKKKCLKM